MSRIIDALQKKKSEENPIQKDPDMDLLSREAHRADRPQRISPQAQKQLADVYFKDLSKTAKLPEPTVVRVTDNRRSYLWPLLIVSVLFFLLLIVVVLNKRITVHVQIDEMQQAPVAASAPAPVKAAAVEPENATLMSQDGSLAYNRPKVTNSVKDAPEVLSISPLEFHFAGAAMLNSSRDRQQLILMNSSIAGVAYAEVLFNPPLDATPYELAFEVRGRIGNEKIEVIFKDANDNSSLNWKEIKLFNDGMGTEWSQVQLRVEDSEYFNAHALKQLRIEIGTQRTANTQDAVVFVRNIQWIPISPFLDPSVQTSSLTSAPEVSQPNEGNP